MIASSRHLSTYATTMSSSTLATYSNWRQHIDENRRQQDQWTNANAGAVSPSTMRPGFGASGAQAQRRYDTAMPRTLVPISDVSAGDTNDGKRARRSQRRSEETFGSGGGLLDVSLLTCVGMIFAAMALSAMILGISNRIEDENLDDRIDALRSELNSSISEHGFDSAAAAAAARTTLRRIHCTDTQTIHCPRPSEPCQRSACLMLGEGEPACILELVDDGEACRAPGTGRDDSGTCRSGLCVRSGAQSAGQGNVVAKSQHSTHRPAILHGNTCSCPIRFTRDAPVCQEHSSWQLSHVARERFSSLVDPTASDGQDYVFDVHASLRSSTSILSGEGVISVTNTGDESATLSSISLLLEHIASTKVAADDDDDDVDERQWRTLGAALENRASACNVASTSCPSEQSSSSKLTGARSGYCSRQRATDVCETSGIQLQILSESGRRAISLQQHGDIVVEPTIDNDGDGLRDEDPLFISDYVTDECASIHDNDGDGQIDEDPLDGIDNDGDGRVDEDGPNDDFDCVNDQVATPNGNCTALGSVQRVDEDGMCEDGLHMRFAYSINATEFGASVLELLHSPLERFRLRLLTTFVNAGTLGDTCSVDVDCDGRIDNNVRTLERVQEFYGFGRCEHQCAAVRVEASDVVSSPPGCIALQSDSTSIDELGSITLESPSGLSADARAGRSRQSLDSGIGGTVSCVNRTDACQAQIVSVLHMVGASTHGGGGGGDECDERHLHSSPARATIAVECSGAQAQQ